MLFTEEVFDKLVQAMQSGVYVKCNGDFSHPLGEEGGYAYCILGLAAHMNKKELSYYYDLNLGVASYLIEENDKENDSDFTRLLQYLLEHKEEYITK